MYAELHCISNFTFLRGASHPAELVERAKALGYAALALTDECSLAGVVRAHAAAREAGLPLIVGSEFRLADGLRFVALAESRGGYGALSRFVTKGRRAASKGRYRLTRADLDAGLPDCLALWLPGAEPARDEGAWLRERFEGRLWVAVELAASGADRERLERLTALAGELSLPAVAAGDVHMHQRRRRALQDLLTAVRLKTTVAHAGRALHPNGERALRPLERIESLYPRPLVDATRDIAGRCRFSLDELRYEYPEEIVPAGTTPAAHLRRLVEAGAARRWPAGPPAPVRQLIERELALIAELGYERYFLTVHDLVEFARGRGILCQGRGSAANSAACYALGITEVDPARMSMLFERFISRERNEPPDIDVDFEHERREEVIQYLYAKYGRARAALTATVICYRPKSAVRDVGKALGLDPAQVERLARAMQWWDGREVEDSRIRDAGFDTANPAVARVLALTRELIGFPRHLSQHTGGFVISRGPLEELVPIENAAMPERTVIQWDKDDLDELRLLKVDVLGLGMLTAIRRALALVSARRGAEFGLPDIPAEDPAVYEMICRADTIGVFQIESRAQMAMLPRLRPAVLLRPRHRGRDRPPRPDPGPDGASVPAPAQRPGAGRLPGPGSGGRAHAHARRADLPGAGDAARDRGRGVHARRGGQRCGARWRPGSERAALGPFEQRLVEGMRARGYDEGFARQVFQQILGFGEYGFPEAHAASFALLVYVSAWLKRHEPAAFCCALLNSQPMGFYAPAQLVRDARAHGVTVLAVDVNASAVESTLETAGDGDAGGPARPRPRAGARARGRPADRRRPRRGPLRAGARARAPRAPRAARTCGARGRGRPRGPRRPPPPRRPGRCWASRRRCRCCRSRRARRACRCCRRRRRARTSSRTTGRSGSRWRGIRLRSCARGSSRTAG